MNFIRILKGFPFYVLHRLLNFLSRIIPYHQFNLFNLEFAEPETEFIGKTAKISPSDTGLLKTALESAQVFFYFINVVDCCDHFWALFHF